MKKILATISLLLVLLVIASCKPSTSQEEKSTDTKSPVSYSLASSAGAELVYSDDRPDLLDNDNAKITDNEMNKAADFFEKSFLADAEVLPFSVKIGGADFSKVIKEYKKTISPEVKTSAFTKREITYTHPTNNVQISVEATRYFRTPTIEWTVYIKNIGNGPTPLINGLNSFDMNLSKEDDTRGYILHTWNGSFNSSESYRPYVFEFRKGQTHSIGAWGDHSTFNWMSVFNVEWLNDKADWGKEGLLVSVGWSATWIANFKQSETDLKSCNITAGQKTLQVILQPGEKIRSPLMTVMFWEKDFIRSQNIFRKFQLDDVVPKTNNGKPIGPERWASSSVDYNLMQNATEENQVNAIKKFKEAGFNINGWLMDAGWVTQSPYNPKWDYPMGNLTPDATRFPNGLKPIQETAHANNIRTLVWYEPERVMPGTDIFNNHKEWLLQLKVVPGGQDTWAGFNLFDFSNNEAAKWMTDTIVKSIKDNGVDVYREDHNMNSEWYLRSKDSYDRYGYTENMYVQNKLKFFDDIMDISPSMYIDLYGRRTDMEQLKRGIPLFRTERCFYLTTTQCNTYGVNMVMPISGGSFLNGSADAPAVKDLSYEFRSCLAPQMFLAFSLKDVNKYNKACIDVLNEQADVANYFYGDYYPMSYYSSIEKDWMAWQFNSPDENTGMVQVFKRKNTGNIKEQTFRFSGLDKRKTYEITDYDTKKVVVAAKGSDLMTKGLTINVSLKIQKAILLTYKAR